MLKKIFKYKNLIITGGFLFTLFFYSRLTNLANLPIFTDEAIYVRWAQIASQDASWRFISLTDGKQPLFIWGALVFIRLVNDPLMAGRLVSVISGSFSMIGIAFLAWELLRSKKAAFFASLLYIISPFSLFYDRMALMDSMVATFTIWSLYFEILLIRKIKLDVALILGMVLGGAALTKTSGFLNIYLLPTTLILFDWKDKKRFLKLIKWAGLALLAIILAQIYYSVLRLSPWFHMIAQKNTVFLYPLNEWLEHPWRFLIGNLKGEFDWLWRYLTLPIMTLILIALLTIFKDWKEKLLLFVWFVLPFFGLALFGKSLYPRFILSMTIPLLVMAAWSLNQLTFLIESKFNLALKTKLFIILSFILLFIIYPLYVDYKILFSVITAPIPRADSNQYVNDWPSGWGIRETVDILKKEAKNQKITVFTEGNFGLLPSGIEIYLVNNPNIEIIGIWPIPDSYTKIMKEKIAKKPVYYIANQFDTLPLKWNAKLIEEYQKGNREKRFLRLYQLLEVPNL